MKRFALLTAVSVVALTLSACGGGGDQGEQPAPVTNVEDMGNMTEMPMNVTTEAPAAPRIDNASTESRPEQVQGTTEEQTRDDADATGMTARVSRDEPGNDTGQPAQ